jgi:MFS family permease
MASVDETSPWAPLANTRFRILWVAQFVSGIGTWMQTVGAQWLLLDDGPTLVALVQTAASLPVFLLALPAGVLADLTDRRRLLELTQYAMAAVAGVLAVLAIVSDVPPWLLLTLTFLIGCGTSIVGPAWQAIQPDIVPPDQLRQAAALSSVNTNIGRAVGPSLGGLVVALAGAGWAFAANALSFVVIAFTVSRYAPASRKPSDAEREHTLAAVRSGGRYLRYAPGVRRILLRALLFVPAGSVLWALLPTVAHDRMHLGSGGYGLLLGLLGAGAVSGAFILPRLTHRIDSNGVLAACGVVFAATVAVLPFCANAWLAVIPLLLAGAAWIGALSTLNAATQLRLPGWVRARGLAFYLVAFMGGQAVGSLVWGVLASAASLTVAMEVAAVLLLLGALSVRVLPLHDGAKLDRSVVHFWAEPVLMFEPRPTDGPVLVTVEYRVPAERHAAFTRAMTAVERSRRRTGASRWGLFQDTADPDQFIETFVVPSWAEHLAQHHSRITGADRDVEERAQALAVGEPLVRHAIQPEAA